MGDEKNPELLAKILRILLSRYSAIINEKEQKTVGEIKAMVSKDDLTIQSVAQSFSGEKYSFPENYNSVAEKCFKFVRDEITTFEPDLGISYWLLPKDIVAEKVADDEDKAILLCSLLYCLGDINAEVVIAELENGLPHAFVATEFFPGQAAAQFGAAGLSQIPPKSTPENSPMAGDENTSISTPQVQGKFCILDPCQQAEFGQYCGQKQDVLAMYAYKESKIKKFLYRFNNSKYEQYTEKNE